MFPSTLFLFFPLSSHIQASIDDFHIQLYASFLPTVKKNPSTPAKKRIPPTFHWVQPVAQEPALQCFLHSPCPGTFPSSPRPPPASNGVWSIIQCTEDSVKTLSFIVVQNPNSENSWFSELTSILTWFLGIV